MSKPNIMQVYDDQRLRGFGEWFVRLAGKTPDTPYPPRSEQDPTLGPRRAPWALKRVRRGSLQRLVLFVVVGYLALLGFIQVATGVGETIAGLYPNEVYWMLDRLIALKSDDVESWHGDELSTANPVACLSHNDEWRNVPLYSALAAGCQAVEVDVWYFNEDTINVGHDPSDLRSERILTELYLEPLMELVSKANPPLAHEETTHPLTSLGMNGIFSADPSQSLVLMIDMKTTGENTWNELERELEPLRSADFLTHFNGTAVVSRPITVVVSGSASFDLVVANQTYRDIFFDAPLEQLADNSATWPNPNRLPDEQRPPPNVFLPEGSSGDTALTSSSTAVARRDPDTYSSHLPESYGPANSYFASSSFQTAVGRVWGSQLTQEQLQRIRAQIRGAHQHGLRARYYDIPSFPIGLRNHIWHIITREGVDILSIDDLSGATRRDWRRGKGWFY